MLGDNDGNEPVEGVETVEDKVAPKGGTDDDIVILAEDEPEDDDGEDDDSDEGADEAGKPAKRSRSQRYKDRIARLERELEETRQRPVRRPVPKAGDELVAPKETDFPNDYLAFDRAMRAYETKKAIRDEAQRGEEAAEAEEAQREHRLRINSYNRNLEGVKDRIPDFDKVMADARNMEVRDDVRDLILESTKGPLIAYHLAKNPDKADEINRMSATQAARAIGSLEARIRGPKANAVTAAKPSPKPPKGGAGAVQTNPDKMNNEQYRAWRAKQKD